MFKPIRHLVLSVAFWACFVTTGLAQSSSVTIAWDPNTEPDVAGYTVYWGTQSGVYTSSVTAGNVTSYTMTGLTAGATYYFAVQAFNAAGLTSPLSQEVMTTVPSDTNHAGETIEAWKARFRITDLTADPDGDGVTNQAEFDAGTDPLLPNTWFLAEGSVGFFTAQLALANPGTDTADITVTFLREGATPVTRDYTVPALSRTSIDVASVPGLYGYSFSTTITTRRGGVIAERTMTWGGPANNEAGHTGKAVRQPLTAWYFAEGEASFFDTYLLLANPNTSPVSVTVTYLTQGGAPVRQTYTVAASARRTILANQIPGVAGRSFSMSVQSTLPISAERAMYFSAQGRWWKGGHDSAGAESASTTWFVAEGRTGNLFDEYILLANPNPTPTTATVRFLRPAGPVIARTYTLAAQSRTTIFVDEIPGLEDTDVSASITAGLPIVVERSMYWPNGFTAWHEAHNSVAITSAGTKWAMAEGQQGGRDNTATYILLANPSDQDAVVTLTVLRDGTQPPVVIGRTVRANTRLTVSSGELALSPGEKFGFVAESTNNVPFVVERSMYWDARGQWWAAGTNETGIKLQ
jgi:hypothetical protein